MMELARGWIMEVAKVAWQPQKLHIFAPGRQITVRRAGVWQSILAVLLALAPLKSS